MSLSLWYFLMQTISVKLKKLTPPKDDLISALDAVNFEVKEKDILVFASKVVAIHQGRTVEANHVGSKDQLIMQEAEKFIPRRQIPQGYVLLTKKDNTIIASAGIDESNGNGYYILWPQNIQDIAKELYQYLQKRFNVKSIGVVISDSHSIPLRHGAMGIGIGFYGIYPFIEYAGKNDIFDRQFKFERTNLVDSLAAVGTLAMGEGAEQTPLAILRDVSDVEFIDKDFYDEWVVPEDDDIYRPLLTAFQEKDDEEQ